MGDTYQGCRIKLYVDMTFAHFEMLYMILIVCRGGKNAAQSNGRGEPRPYNNIFGFFRLRYFDASALPRPTGPFARAL